MGIFILLIQARERVEIQSDKYEHNEWNKCELLDTNKREAKIQPNLHTENIRYRVIAQMANTQIDENNFGYPFINEKRKYARIIIQKVK